MELAAAKLFRAKWSDAIHDEWGRNLLANRPDLDEGKLKRTRRLMDAAVPDGLVTGYEGLVAGLNLPDEDDRHVLAAAIASGSDAIVTFNLKDFPAGCVDRYDIEVVHPDDFIHLQFDLDKAAVVVAARRCRSRLRNPPRTATQYLDKLDVQGLTRTVDRLRAYHAVI